MLQPTKKLAPEHLLCAPKPHRQFEPEPAESKLRRVALMRVIMALNSRTNILIQVGLLDAWPRRLFTPTGEKDEILKFTSMAGRWVAIAGAAMLMLAITPAMAFTLSQLSVAPGAAAGSQIDRVWWDSRGFGYPDNNNNNSWDFHPDNHVIIAGARSRPADMPMGLLLNEVANFGGRSPATLGVCYRDVTLATLRWRAGVRRESSK